jgi:ketosteroid isomerase-like protein
MTRKPAALPFALLIAAAAPTFAFAQTPEAAPPAPTFSAEECKVWDRELAFADSVAKHDAKGFPDFLHPQAVFNATSPQPTRGRDAIVKEWAGIVDGSAVLLSWYPTVVVIGGEKDIAFSSGPALLESPDPKAKDRYGLVHFTSTWHRDADGTWRVLFDAGSRTRPASAEEVAVFRAGRKACPRS